MNNQNTQKGFTLIEIMIVVAILGLLLAYTVPAYRDSATRSKAGECLALANSAKIAVSEYWTTHNNLSQIKNNKTVSFALSKTVTGTNVKKVTVRKHGLIKCFFTTSDENLNGKHILLTPEVTGSSLSWSCKSNLKQQHIPHGCKLR